MYAFTCPHCGAGVSYDLSNGAVSCEYCDSVITLDEYEAYLDRKGKYQTVELSCPQCGSVVLSYDNTIATFCSYCGSSVIFDRRVKEEQKPDGIIPFAFKEKAAANRYRERTDKILLAPDWMREDGRQELTGIYMPFYQYRADSRAKISAKGETHRSLGRDYTEVSVYQVDGTLQSTYEGNRFDAAVAFPDALSESIDTFSYAKAVPFRPAYVAGFYADGSDIEPETYDPVMARLVSDDINATHSVTFEGMSVPLSNATTPADISLSRKKILLPVWLLTHRVKDRICYAAVNGTNGDVAADIPLDRGKYLKVSLIAAAVIATVLNIFLTVKPQPFLWISMAITTVFGILLGRLTQDVYVRENHLDDIGRIGYQAFAGAVKNLGRTEKQKSGGILSGILVFGVIMFFVLPAVTVLLGEIFPDFDLDFSVFLIPLILLVTFFRFISGLIRSGSNAAANTPYKSTHWKYSKSRAASFAVLWKAWLASAFGAGVLMSGTVVDTSCYGARLANSAVSVWAAFDAIRKQNLLASRDIPIFTMKRGGAE